MRTETDRLALVPIGVAHAGDLWRLHQDPWVAAWYAGTWSRQEAESFASFCARGWELDGVSKWIAYDRYTGDLVGRGGLSRLSPSSTATMQIDALLDDPGWRADRLEMGWAVVSPYRGRGMATEIGRAALTFARDELGASRVIAFTERHNLASRGVMEKAGMSLVGEIRERGLVEGQDGEADNAPFVVYASTHLSPLGKLLFPHGTEPGVT